jgi:hypothetical protein
MLVAILVVDLWYRAHTFGPTIAEATGIVLWPACSGASEPLDCDEAAYAYMGHRMIQGDVLYRDLTENKPPLGYWLYAMGAVAAGSNELAIRLLPIPAILSTIVLIWWIAGKLAGPLAAYLAAGLYVVLSTDPYLFGNGSNLEHFMNLFSVASLALFSVGWRSHRGEAWGLRPQPPGEGVVGGCGGAKRHHRRAISGTRSKSAGAFCTSHLSLRRSGFYVADRGDWIVQLFRKRAAEGNDGVSSKGDTVGRGALDCPDSRWVRPVRGRQGRGEAGPGRSHSRGQGIASGPDRLDGRIQARQSASLGGKAGRRSRAEPEDRRAREPNG